jgi:hypothetical protein
VFFNTAKIRIIVGLAKYLCGIFAWFEDILPVGYRGCTPLLLHPGASPPRPYYFPLFIVKSGKVAKGKRRPRALQSLKMSGFCLNLTNALRLNVPGF